MTILRFACLLLFTGSLYAAEPPKVPASDRILSSKEVKNYWLNAIPKIKLPAKGNGLHPEQQAKRERVIQERKALMHQIKQGAHDVDAKLASLAHNVDAHIQRGEEKKSKLAEERLYTLREHLSKLATLEAQREAARKLSEAADQIASLESEIASLNQTISSHACNSSCD